MYSKRGTIMTTSSVRVLFLFFFLSSITTNNIFLVKHVSAWLQQQQSKRQQSAPSLSRKILQYHDGLYPNDKSSLLLLNNIKNTKDTAEESPPQSLLLHNSIIKPLRSVLVTTSLLSIGWWSSTILPLPPMIQQNDNFIVHAKEMASGSGSRVNKDPESLLRYGLPIQNKDVRKLQAALEDIKYNIASKRKTAAIEDTKKAKTILSNTGSVTSMKSSCRDASICDTYIQNINTELDAPNLSTALKEFQDSVAGSDQERIALDKAYEAQTKAVGYLSKLEEQMIPAGYKTPVPDAYNDMVQLQGRAKVVMTIKKPSSSAETFLVDGKSFPEAKLTMIIDGYAAPITSGNFIDLVTKKFYDGMNIQRSDGFVIQTGNPEGEADGYVGTGSKAIGNGPHGERLIPLEIFVKGDKGPFYESTIEDEMRGGQATVLPFSSYGAMGWAREEYEPNSGSSQFFWLLFDSDLTPAGKNVLDGRYPCFGYVVDGADFLSVIKEDDIIVSAKVTEGLENLIQPKV